MDYKEKIEKELKEVIKDRNELLNELKNMYITDKDLDYIIKVICSENLVIATLKHILEDDEKSK